jgi:hypothetical protein
VVKTGQLSTLLRYIMVASQIGPSAKWSKGQASNTLPSTPQTYWSGEIAMENKARQSHEDREAQTLVDRIEKKVEASEEIAKQAETKRTLDDYAKKVGS